MTEEKVKVKLNLTWIADKMGYNNKWKFIQALIWDVGIIAAFWFFAVQVSELTLICPNGSEGFSIGDYNFSKIDNISVNVSVS